MTARRARPPPAGPAAAAVAGRLQAGSATSAGQAVLPRQLALAAVRFGRRHRRPAPARHHADARGAAAAGHPRASRRRPAEHGRHVRALTMEAYLVGGAVRDRLLGLPPGDRDYVVVGADASRRWWRAASSPWAATSRCSCIRDTGEEYALARTERKSGRGLPRLRGRMPTRRSRWRRTWAGATSPSTPSRRRDDGNAGRSVRRRRATSRRACCATSAPAFVEDPVRVLRAARFLARFAPLGFTVAAGDAGADARAWSQTGELAQLTPERVWQELRRALAAPAPSAFIAHAARLRRARGGCCRKWTRCTASRSAPSTTPRSTPACHVDWSATWPRGWRRATTCIGFAALVHDLGKALTPATCCPSHIGHERAGLAPLRALCERLKVPTAHRQLAEAACREHLNVHRFDRAARGDRARPDRTLRRFPPARSASARWPRSAKPTSAAAPAWRTVRYPQGDALRAAA